MKKALSLFLCLLLPVLMLAACGQPADDRTPEELFYALPVSSGITETLEDSALYDLFASGQPLRMNVDFSLDKFTIPMQADLSGTAFSFSMDCNSKADLRGNLTVDMPDEKVACDLLMTGENAYVFSDTLGEKWLPIPISSLFGQTGIDLGNELSASLNTQLLTRIEPVLTGCLDAMLNALRSYPLTTEQVSVVCGELEETGTAVTLELTAEQLITPLAGALTYLRDSSDAYSLITELSGEPMTEAEYREAIDDAIAELNESASELPDISLKLTRTFKEGRQLSAAFTLTGDDSIEVAGELITLNPSSRKQAFSLDVRAAQQGAELLTLTADGSRNGGEKLLSAVKDLCEETDGAPLAAAKDEARARMAKNPLADLDLTGFDGEHMMEKFNAPEWKDLYQACLGCGTCTFVCPTCQCYDIRDFDTGHGIQRYRCWDSCMYSDFTMMAAGTNRKTQMERFRQRFMHKLVYFPANNEGMYSCVGCGRCVSKCPMHLHIAKVIRTLGGKKQ